MVTGTIDTIVKLYRAEFKINSVSVRVNKALLPISFTTTQKVIYKTFEETLLIRIKLK